MIPKIVHYCWFGKNEKSEMILKCIDSWKKFLPDWEFIEWNEGNYDINKNKYTSSAYELKKWAFVSDFARLEILYEYGGIYLDVDVEFIKPLPEELLQLQGFCGFECTGNIAPGLIFGVEKNNSFIKSIIDSYKDEEFTYQKDGIYETINLRITKALVNDGLVKNNMLQTVNGFTIFPSEVFCGYDTDIREPAITENTICLLHYLGSRSNPSMKMKLQNVLKKIVGVSNYKRIIVMVRKLRTLRKLK